MKVLVDSHIFVWLLYEPDRITAKTAELITAADKVYVSIVSLWELTLKYSKHTFDYSPKHLMEGLHALNATLLPLSAQHVLEVPEIKLPHKDPFDITLVAQSEIEGCEFLTADKSILRSGYKVVAA